MKTFLFVLVAALGLVSAAIPPSEVDMPGSHRNHSLHPSS